MDRPNIAFGLVVLFFLGVVITTVVQKHNDNQLAIEMADRGYCQVEGDWGPCDD